MIDKEKIINKTASNTISSFSYKKNLLSYIGNTPLVSLSLPEITLQAKLEYFNPGGSIKDRSALYMIEYAEKHNLLKPGYTIIDASSGNHGIALAMIGAIKDYKVIISTSEKISEEKLATLRSYNAEVIISPVTDTITDPKSYHQKALTIAAKENNCHMPNQYFNPLNAQAHYYSLGPELWNQTKGNITHFFAAAGTGGTVSGAGRYLKEKNKNIQVIAVDSINSFRSTNGNPKPYYIEGMGIDFDSPVMDYTVIDEVLTVSDKESLTMLKKVSHNHGLLVGLSSGAVIAAAQNYFLNNPPKQQVYPVVICGDSGRAYLSKTQNI